MAELKYSPVRYHLALGAGVLARVEGGGSSLPGTAPAGGMEAGGLALWKEG